MLSVPNLIQRIKNRLKREKERTIKEFSWKEGISFHLENSEDDSTIKILEIHMNGVKVGYAHLEASRNKILVNSVFVYDNYRNKRFSSQLIEGVNSYLDYAKKDGLLENWISHFNSNDPAVKEKKGLYRRHGWERSRFGMVMKRKFQK